ncbi:glyoxalase [Streptomyces tubercidicus]|uniref:glyoxalase n=1 Tax=Streptomyces tubercidicus TaxID=47759 RepID=UPI0034654CD5
MCTGIRTIVIFAEDPEKSARWRSHVLDTPVHRDLAGTNVHTWLDVADIELGFHMLDEQHNKRGGSPVPYRSVKHLDTAREMLLGARCTHHRGPLDVEAGTGCPPGRPRW